MEQHVETATDEDLLATYAAGDDAAFAEIVRRHGGMVLSASRRLAGRHVDADDVAQDVFVALAASVRAGKPVERLPGWLRVTARHVASHARDAAAARRRHEAAAAADRARAAAEPVDDAEMRRALTEALGEIGDRYRIAVVRHYLERRSLDEIARELGAPIGTVGWWLARGRDLLRERLARRGHSLAQVAHAGLLAPAALDPASSFGVPWARAWARVHDAMAGAQPAAAQAPGWIVSVVVHGVLFVLITSAALARLQRSEDAPRDAALQRAVSRTALVDTSGDGAAAGDGAAVAASGEAAPCDAHQLAMTIPEEAREPTPTPRLELDDASLGEVARAEEPIAADIASRVVDLGGADGRAFLADGGGGGGSGGGLFATRSGIARKRALQRFGGSRASEAAVDAALRWFKRHQAQDGAWRVGSYQTHCADAGPRCEPGTAHDDVEGDIACTGYAVLCYLGAGYDQRLPSRYRATVQRGVEWLVAQQQGDGTWLGARTLYGHAVAAMALAEAYAMAGDPSLREPAQRAIDVILQRQTPDPARAKNESPVGLGWDYAGANAARNDTSVTGWQVMALKSARAAGLEVRNGLDGARRWLDRSWKACNPGWRLLTDPDHDQSYLTYGWSPTSGLPSGHAELASVGALCAALLGRNQGDAMLESLCNAVASRQLPTGYPTNLYSLYYGTLAMFQAGGHRWEAWNHQVRDLLIDAQRRDAGCFEGSWDPGGYDFGVGRLLSSAWCCLSLEVYYRYVPAIAKPARGP